MPKPVCVACKCFYRPHKNGFAWTEGMPIATVDMHGRQETAEGRRGLRAPETWKPYKCWMGDLWRCPDCGHEIIVGVVGGPFAEHYQADFKEKQKAFGADQLQVNDC